MRNRITSKKFFLTTVSLVLLMGCNLNDFTFSTGQEEPTSTNMITLSPVVPTFVPTLNQETPDIQSQIMSETLWISPTSHWCLFGNESRPGYHSVRC
jgi:hypothetical protein